MNILLAVDALYPVQKYGGTERVVYSLGKALSDMGHDVTMLCRAGSQVPFAHVLPINPATALERQVSDCIDVAHFNNYTPSPAWERPHIVTYHGNGIPQEKITPWTVFVSRDHARRHGCDSWVYNGLDWDEYGTPDLTRPRNGFHFLGNAAWRVKNVGGAIDVIAGMKGETLEVLGGRRFNFKMGLRLTFNPRIHFHGMVTNEGKQRYIEQSKGLVFPVTWHEPFGLCLIESMYYGAPVFGTPYGSLPELVIPETGALTTDSTKMRELLRDAGAFDPKVCHDYAAENFNASVMARAYLRRYEHALEGHPLVTLPAIPSTADWRHLPWR